MFQAGQRVGVAEHVRVGRHDHVDVVVLAVQPDRFRCGRQVVGRRLALLLRTVFRVRLDVETEQVKQGHGEVLAGGDGTPATDRVHAHGGGALGRQVRVLAAVDGQVAHPRVGIDQVLLVDLLLGVGRGVVYEVDRQVKKDFCAAVRQHVLDRGNQRLRLQVAAAEAEAARVQPRHVVDAVTGVAGMGRLSAACGTVLEALGDGGAHLAEQRQVFGQWLVGTLQHGDAACGP